MPTDPRAASSAAPVGPRPVARRALLSGAALAVGSGAAAACSPDTPTRRATATSSRTPAAHELVARAGDGTGAVDPTTVRDPATLSAATVSASRALVERSTAVVVTSAGAADVTEADRVARRLGLPLLVAGEGLDAELERLGVRTVVRVATAPSASSGSGATSSPGPTDLPTRFGTRQVVDGTSPAALDDLLGLPLHPAPRSATVLLVRGAKLPPALEATVAAVGGVGVGVPQADPRASDQAVAALRARPDDAVLALGSGIGDTERLTRRVRTARRAPELPGGGLLPFPGRMMVALYGHPGTASLGMLGEQSAADAARRATALTKEYAALTRTPVVPAFELIATVASGSKGPDGDYSTRTAVSRLMPWVQQAERSGAYVVLDLQPGRTDFLTQAKAYEVLLRRPWVGLALDPEWRLGPKQKHLDQIGSVDVDEVNAVGAWLAGLVRAHDLPPKVLTLHQFRSSMVRGRERLDTSLDEVQWLVHADGQGGQGAKQDTWRALRRDLPEHVWLGWKNFEDEDAPMLTPAQTLQQVRPTPQLVSYQ